LDWIYSGQDCHNFCPITANYRTVNGKLFAWIFTSQILNFKIEALFAVLRLNLFKRSQRFVWIFSTILRWKIENALLTHAN
jgi:hypothetical protein